MSKAKSLEQDAVVSVINSDLVDRMVFRDVAEQSQNIQELCSDESTEGLAQDIFSSLYKFAPKVQEEAPKVQRELIEQMMQMPEYRGLHGDTRTNDLMSAMGFLKLAPHVLEQFQEVQEELSKQEPKQDESGNPIEQGLADLSDEFQAGIRARLRAAINNAQDSAQDAKEKFRAWGVGEGELQRIPLNKKMELLEKIKSRKSFDRIAELMGRFNNVMNAVEATTFQHGVDEIVDIETGSDISRILPAELLKLHMSPALFYKDMIEGNLMQYQLKGTERLGRGPIIECMDISGSMQGIRNEWCKAATLTLIEVCRKQKRAFGLISFDTQVRYDKFWEAGQSPTLQEKINISEIFTGGGTDFAAPLKRAINMRLQSPDLKPADIVFITDGDCQLNPKQIEAVLKFKIETHTRIFGIGIGDCRTSSLEPFCDEISILDFSGNTYSLSEVQKLIKTVSGG